MKPSIGVRVSCLQSFAACLTVLATFSFGAPPVLRWNPTSTNLWSATSLTWLDAGDNAVAWQPGSEARFEGSGGIVNIAADASVSNITFTGSGYTLIGSGRLSVEGAVSAAATTTNSMAVDLLTVAGLSKTGTGALALARCTGPFAVQAGTLLVSGSGFSDADLSVASGATLVTLGDPDPASNLIVNPSFESPALAAGNWGYVSTGVTFSDWTVTAFADHVGLQNTAAAGSPWNSEGTSPDGSQMLILQYDGAVAQTVSVPAAGVYSVAFSYLLRNGHPDHQVYVTLDGTPLADFLNRSVQFSPGRFASGAIYLKAGSHTLGIGGEGHWGDRASMIDAVCLAAPSAAAGRVFGGDSILRVVTGASVVLNHSGALAIAKVSINGAATSGTFASGHASLIFSGAGSLACSNPEYVFEAKGLSGNWSNSGLWADGAAPTAGGGQNLRMFFPSAASTAVTNSLSGTFAANRLRAAGVAAGGSFALSGNAVALTNDANGTAPTVTLAAPGAWTAGNAITAQANLTFDVDGTMTLGSALAFSTNTLTLAKRGPGTLVLPSVSNVGGGAVYEGTLQTPALPPGLPVSLLSRNGKAAALYLTQGGQTVASAIELMGSGIPTFGTRCGGGTVTCSNWAYGYGDTAVFDVGPGDTLSILQMLLFNNTLGYSATSLTKAGPGTLEIRSAGSDGGNSRAYQGNTTLRNGTLILSEDDFGTLSGVTNPFNGRTYSGTGGSLGYNAFTNALRIGDSGTAPSDTLALVASGSGRYVGHDIEVLDKGSSVTLGMTAGTAMFAGTVTLHRDVVLSGPADGIMVFNTLVAAPGFVGSGIPTLSGLAGLRIEGSLPAETSLLLGGRALRFGTYAVRAQTLNALVIGSSGTPATLDVDFGPDTNDIITVTMNNGLVVSNTVVNLTYAGSGVPFAEPGTYTLFSYTGALGGDAALSVGNPQSGAVYAFSNDTVHARVLLTISGTSGNTSAVWKHPAGGSWSVGSNWDSGSVPGGAGVSVLFGAAITTPATVAVDGGVYTVGGLIFNNAAYGYLLSGGSLTFNNNGAPPTVSVLAGTHTLDTALGGSAGLSVSTAPGAALILGSNAVVNTGLSLAAGTVELQGSAKVNGAAALADSASLRVAGADIGLGTLTGAASSAIGLSGTSPKLTVSQVADGTFAGTLAGNADATLVKTGAGALELAHAGSTFAGVSEIAGGTLALMSAALPGTVSLGSSSELAVQVPATNGLTGYYYNVTPDTNNFWTLAGMESHFASLTPNLVAVSSLAGADFNFGSDGSLFPLPYGPSGSRTVNFEAVWRGTITVPDNGTYTFGLYADDGVLLAIDGQPVIVRNRYDANWTDGMIRLDTGRHDIVIAYFQQTGGLFLQARVRRPGAASAVMLPNAWLTPYSTVGRVTGTGVLSLAASNALLRTAGGTFAEHKGALTGAAGSLLAKSGSGALVLSGGSADALSGDVDAQGGTLALTATECIGNASSLRVRSGASLAVASSETVGRLAGTGRLWIGGYVYATPFAGEADCDISTSKSYTHLVDLPTGTTTPVVNGVTFGNIGSWSYTAGTAPTGAWNEAPADNTRTGIDSLLWDFQFGSTDYTLTLSGLTVGRTYETRLYFRNFGGNPRNLTFTFTTGGTVIGSLYYNPDSVTRSWVGCRYTAEAASLQVRIFSHESGHTAHLYGFSNEEASGTTAAAALTLAPAAGENSRFTGNIFGSGVLVKTGAGTQTLGGTSALAHPLEVEEGALALEAGAAVVAGVAVAAGATVEAASGGVTLGGLTGEGTFSLGSSTNNAEPYFATFAGDADCGISASKTYTHLLDFGSNGNKAIVNGVTFDKVTATSGSIAGYGWSGAPPIPHPGGNDSAIGVSPSQGIYSLIYDMNYNLRSGTFYLTGLTLGKRYEVRFYNRKWEPNGMNRSQTFTFDPDGAGPLSDTVTFNPDATPAGVPNDNYLGYRYLAATNFLAVTILSETADTFHLYGLSNEESYDTLGSPVTLDIAGTNVFAGAVTGLGGMAKSGAGTLTLTGSSTATGPLSVNAGAFGVANGGRATAGPVSVSAGATLFGDGQAGGDVTVASNAWLHAGTPEACGTLQIGGSLTLEPGALLAYRFGAANGNDTVAVSGPLTLPPNGVIQAVALAEGVRAPAKDVFFSSPQAINGPADLSGWTVEGVKNASLKYSGDRTIIYFTCPNGTLLRLR